MMVLVQWTRKQGTIVGGEVVERCAGDQDLLPMTQARGLEAVGLLRIVGKPGDVAQVYEGAEIVVTDEGESDGCS